MFHIFTFKVEVITHFPRVSARSSRCCNKALCSFRLLHHEVDHNDKQKRGQDDPLKDSGGDIEFFR